MRALPAAKAKEAASRKSVEMNALKAGIMDEAEKPEHGLVVFVGTAQPTKILANCPGSHTDPQGSSPSRIPRNHVLDFETRQHNFTMAGWFSP